MFSQKLDSAAALGKSRFRNTRMPESVSDRLRLRQVHLRKACSELINVYPIIHYTVNMPLLSMCVFTDIILIMKNRHHHPRRSFLRDGKQHKKLRLNFTLRGEKGKPVRIALCCAAGLVLLVLLAALLKRFLPKAAKGLKSSLRKNSLRICFPTPPGMRRQNSSP